MDRGAAAKIGGMDRQTLRDWVHRFNASGPEGLIDNWTEGPKPRLSAEQFAQFAQIVEAGPDREKDGVVRWRRIDLKRVIAGRFGVDFHPRYGGKLHQAWLLPHQRAAASSGSGRTDHRGVQKNFPRALKAHLDGLPETTPVEIWFADVPRQARDEGLHRPEERPGSAVGQARNATQAARRPAL
jgi:transposase